MVVVAGWVLGQIPVQASLKLVNLVTSKYFSLLDSSCGDMTWMPSFLTNRSDVMFTGYDIVEDNIKNHRQSFREKDWKFEVHDIVREGVNLKNKYERVLWDTW